MNESNTLVEVMRMPEMKLCPFCGGRTRLQKPSRKNHYPIFVHCLVCGGSGPLHSNEIDAIKSWNQRHLDTVPIIEKE